MIGAVRVLVVEDQVRLAKLIRQGLIGEACSRVAVRGEDALWMADATAYYARPRARDAVENRPSSA